MWTRQAKRSVCKGRILLKNSAQICSMADGDVLFFRPFASGVRRIRCGRASLLSSCCVRCHWWWTKDELRHLAQVLNGGCECKFVVCSGWSA